MKKGPDLKCYLSMFWNAAWLFTLWITPALCVLFSFHFDCVLYPSSLPLVPLLLFWRRDLGKDVALLPGQKLMIQNVWGLSWLVVLWRCRYHEFLLWRQKLQGSQEKGRKSHVVMHHLADRLCSSHLLELDTQPSTLRHFKWSSSHFLNAISGSAPITLSRGAFQLLAALRMKRSPQNL